MLQAHNNLMIGGVIPVEEVGSLKAWADTYGVRAEVMVHFRVENQRFVRYDLLKDFRLICPNPNIAMLAKLAWGGRNV